MSVGVKSTCGGVGAHAPSEHPRPLVPLAVQPGERFVSIRGPVQSACLLGESVERTDSLQLATRASARLCVTLFIYLFICLCPLRPPPSSPYTK